ncbi:MAG: transcriptional repressor [Paracoccaceae bacterium]
MNIENTAPEQRAATWLAKADLRPTRQRLSLAELLVGDGVERHITAETLFEMASKADVSVSLATIYNTLRAFCEAGLMQEVTVDGNGSYFDTRLDDHAHYYWEDDNTLTDAPVGTVAFQQMPNAPKGTSISKIDVVIRLKRA